MTITSGQVLDAIRHRIGGPVAPELGGGIRVLNLAGRWLDSTHQWKNRLRVSAQLDFTSGDTFLTLPSGLKSIIAAEQPTASGLGRQVVWVSPSMMLTLRNQTSGAFQWDLAVSIENTGTVWRLGLYQVPSATQTDTLRISYYAGWTDVSSDQSAITIPDFMEGVLIESARAWAVGLERGGLQEELMAVEQGPIMMAAKRADGGVQPFLGRMQGGAVDMVPQADDWNEWMRHTNV